MDSSGKIQPPDMPYDFGGLLSIKEIVAMIRKDRDRDDSDPVLTKMIRKMKKRPGEDVVRLGVAKGPFQKLDV